MKNLLRVHNITTEKKQARAGHSNHDCKRAHEASGHSRTTTRCWDYTRAGAGMQLCALREVAFESRLTSSALILVDPPVRVDDADGNTKLSLHRTRTMTPRLHVDYMH